MSPNERVELGLRDTTLPAYPQCCKLAGVDEAMDRPRADAERRGDNFCRQVRPVSFDGSGRFVGCGTHDVMEAPRPEFAFLNSWAAREAADSPLFRDELEDLRQMARVDHPRAGGRALDYDWPGLEELEREGRMPVRPRAHRKRDLPTDEGYRWVRVYRARCRRVAGTRLGGRHMAAAVHELARQDTGFLAVEWLGWAPVGSRASAGAAHITGASHGTGTTANRQAYYRIRADSVASPGPPLCVELKPEDLL